MDRIESSPELIKTEWSGFFFSRSLGLMTRLGNDWFAQCSGPKLISSSPLPVQGSLVVLVTLPDPKVWSKKPSHLTAPNTHIHLSAHFFVLHSLKIPASLFKALNSASFTDSGGSRRTGHPTTHRLTIHLSIPLLNDGQSPFLISLLFVRRECLHPHERQIDTLGTMSSSRHWREAKRISGL